MFKKLLYGIILTSSLASAQVVSTSRGTTIRYDDGSFPATFLYHTPADTAVDSKWIIKNFQYDLGGKTAVFGVDITALWDTFSVQLVLEGAVDNTNWKGVDSLTITTGTPGHYEKNSTILINFKYGYWRLRLGTNASAYRGNIAAQGKATFFIQTKLTDRY